MPPTDARTATCAPLVESRDGLAGIAVAPEDENQPWLGCEGLHPLTWLPAPAPVAARVLTGD